MDCLFFNASFFIILYIRGWGRHEVNDLSEGAIKPRFSVVIFLFLAIFLSFVIDINIYVYLKYWSENVYIKINTASNRFRGIGQG